MQHNHAASTNDRIKHTYQIDTYTNLAGELTTLTSPTGKLHRNPKTPSDLDAYTLESVGLTRFVMDTGDGDEVEWDRKAGAPEDALLSGPLFTREVADDGVEGPGAPGEVDSTSETATVDGVVDSEAPPWVEPGNPFQALLTGDAGHQPCTNPSDGPTATLEAANPHADKLTPDTLTIARTIADRALTSVAGPKRAYGRINTKFLEHSHATGLAFPAHVNTISTIAILVDVSQSMRGPFLDTSLAALNDLTHKRDDIDPWIIECDNVAYPPYRLPDRTPGGYYQGGGTDLREGFARAESLNPRGIVVYTDAATPWPEVRPDCPVTVVVVGNSGAELPGWCVRHDVCV